MFFGDFRVIHDLKGLPVSRTWMNFFPRSKALRVWIAPRIVPEAMDFTTVLGPVYTVARRKKPSQHRFDSGYPR